MGPVQIVLAKSNNINSSRLRARRPLAHALTMATLNNLLRIVRSLAPRALIKVEAVVNVVEVGEIRAAGAEVEAAIKRQRMVVLPLHPLQYLRRFPQVMPQDLQARPCRDGQFGGRKQCLGGECWSG